MPLALAFCCGCFYENMLDASKVSYKDQLRALQETQMKLFEKGLIEVK